MDSINRNQPEEHHLDLRGLRAIEKIREIVEKAESCFFCTKRSSEASSGVRPMNVREVDEVGDLWFLSSKDSYKNQEIARNNTVDLYFQGSPHGGFLHLLGSAVILEDKAKIEALWEPIFKTWFTEGIEDPRISVIKFTPSEGYYWDTKHGYAVAGIKMFIGSIMGKTLDDSVEGRVKVNI
jgi:general stress protein 26